MEVEPYYYDSLDEDDGELSEVLSGASIRPNPRKKNVNVEQEKTPPDISTIVPLYGGETTKSDLKLAPRRSKPLITTLQHRKSVTTIKEKQPPPKTVVVDKRRKKKSSSVHHQVSSENILLPNSKPVKSYLNMFYTKIGYKQGNDGKLGDESARGTTDSLSYRTAVTSSDEDGGGSSTDFSDAMSFVSDTSSFYMKVIENDLKKKSSAATLKDEQLLLENLKSVSEMTINSLKPTKTKSNLKFKKNILDAPSVLGSLGPDPVATREKMQKFKRQQSYGLKVSNENRMKFMERKILKNFQLELKRSTKLNECANNVMNY